jgi:type I restriction enzyme S subunit
MYTPIAYGDVLFAGSGETLEDIGKSAVNLIEAPARCGGDVLILSPIRAMVPEFLGYALAAPSSAHQKYLMGRGVTVMHIYADRLKYLCLPVPPLDEQAAIVRFLDYFDHRVRRFLAAKRTLIARLREQRQAIIYRAVTSGVDTNTRFKSSGLDWLPLIPEHWEVQRNGRLFTQRKEFGFPHLPSLEVSIRTGVRIRDTAEVGRRQSLDRGQYKRAAKGDIAYNVMRMWQGAVGVAPADGLVSTAYVVASPRPGTDSRYFSYLFGTSAYMGEAEKFSRGIASFRNRLYWEDFKRMPSVCPPIMEQRAIADHIDAETRVLGEAIDRATKASDLMRDYRIRMMADAITGKIDVREAAKLAEDADEPDWLDTANDVDDDHDEDFDVHLGDEEE